MVEQQNKTCKLKYLHILYVFTPTWELEWNSLLEECWAPNRKVASSNPGKSSGRIFFSGVNFVC